MNEQRWAADGAGVVVPVLGAGTDIRALLVADRRVDQHPFTRDDVSFLEAVAASTGLGLESVRLRQEESYGKAEAQAAVECPRCSTISADKESPSCPCGVPCVEAPVPWVLNGKLRIERRIGAGGMGVVYLARDLGLDRLVTVKTISGAAATELVRLKQEARSMAAVSHPSIAQIYALESWRGRPLLIVEYLEAGSLADRLTAGPLGVAEALRVANSAASGLMHVHQAGYLHLDVKPSNIAFSADGGVKLLDFGLAQLAGLGGGAAGGTLPYMSPEVLNGRTSEPADDVWALSVVLYESLVGVNPFLGGSTADVMMRVRRGPPPPVVERRPRHPGGTQPRTLRDVES